MDLHWIDGLYVGQLDAEELQAFEQAIADGNAQRVYVGASGFMGLAKVRLIPSEQSEA